MMLRMLQFVNHCSSIILYGDMAISHNIYNHVIFAKTVASGTYTRSHICCRREKHPVYLFFFLQEIQIEFSQRFDSR